jgi:hypothetical protein
LREEAVLSEYVQFAGAMSLFVGILVGSCFFVWTSPSVREDELQSGREDGAAESAV